MDCHHQWLPPPLDTDILPIKMQAMQQLRSFLRQQEFLIVEDIPGTLLIRSGQRPDASRVLQPPAQLDDACKILLPDGDRMFMIKGEIERSQQAISCDIPLDDIAGRHKRPRAMRQRRGSPRKSAPRAFTPVKLPSRSHMAQPFSASRASPFSALAALVLQPFRRWLAISHSSKQRKNADKLCGNLLTIKGMGARIYYVNDA